MYHDRFIDIKKQPVVIQTYQLDRGKAADLHPVSGGTVVWGQTVNALLASLNTKFGMFHVTEISSSISGNLS